jgi:hypothetical protein
VMTSDDPNELFSHTGDSNELTIFSDDQGAAVLIELFRPENVETTQGHEFYQDPTHPRSRGLCDFTYANGDWCGGSREDHYRKPGSDSSPDLYLNIQLSRHRVKELRDALSRWLAK